MEEVASPRELGLVWTALVLASASAWLLPLLLR